MMGKEKETGRIGYHKVKESKVSEVFLVASWKLIILRKMFALVLRKVVKWWPLQGKAMIVDSKVSQHNILLLDMIKQDYLLKLLTCF